MKPHVHAELIKKWADGAEIQFRSVDGNWLDCQRRGPEWLPDNEYRIKPEETKPVVRWLWTDESGHVSKNLFSEEEIKNYGLYIKLEWSRTEFPE